MATAHGRTAVEKGSEIPLSPVGSESEKPAQENIENAAPSKQTSGGSDEEAQQHEFKVIIIPSLTIFDLIDCF